MRNSTHSTSRSGKLDPRSGSAEASAASGSFVDWFLANDDYFSLPYPINPDRRSLSLTILGAFLPAGRGRDVAT